MTELSIEFISQQAERETLFVVDRQQQALTEQWLVPNLAVIAADMLVFRQQFDHAFEHKSTKYPIGFCKEICDGVFTLLKRELKHTQFPGLMAIKRFSLAGGRVKRVWGNLRHCYFQNAIQMGGLYVDVANDSVVPSKPKVEILPLDKADFYPVCDYVSYAQLAQKYWCAEVFPNRYLPQLAVLFPLILRYANGKFKVHSPYQSLLYQNLLSNFHLAEAFLFNSEWRDKRLGGAYMEELTRQLTSANALGCDYLADPVSDESLATLLQKARRDQWRFDAEQCQTMIDLAHAINVG